MSGEKERVDSYAETLKRIEPDIAMIDNGTAAASIAISLKRIADALDSSPVQRFILLMASAIGWTVGFVAVMWPGVFLLVLALNWFGVKF